MILMTLIIFYSTAFSCWGNNSFLGLLFSRYYIYFSISVKAYMVFSYSDIVVIVGIWTLVRMMSGGIVSTSSQPSSLGIYFAIKNPTVLPVVALGTPDCIWTRRVYRCIWQPSHARSTSPCNLLLRLTASKLLVISDRVKSHWFFPVMMSHFFTW